MLLKKEFYKEIDWIVDQLIKSYHPEKIILFGSLVDGNLTEGTDIDLFIVKKDVPTIGVDRIRQLDALVKYRIATDFIVYKPEEVKQRLNLGDPFIKSIITKGKVLYSAV